MINDHEALNAQRDELLADLAKIADEQSLMLATGICEPSPTKDRLAAVLAEHGVSRPCDLKAALDLYDRALRKCSPFLPVPLPSAVQESIDLAQAAYLTATGQEPLSLVQLAPAAMAANPFRMCKDA